MQELITRQEAETGVAISAEVGQAANDAAGAMAFVDYRSRRAPNTVRQQDAALNLFASYLASVTDPAPSGYELARDPQSWAGVTWGLVEGFQKSMIAQSYAISTVNVRVSTVKTYAKLAAKAGALSTEALAMIRTVASYARKEGLRLDERRELAGVPTRVGHKKATANVLTSSQIVALKSQPDTPQGRRDRVLVSLMLDLGLRVSEVAGLAVSNVNLAAGELTFYRGKVDLWQTHRLNGLQKAVASYLTQDAPAIGPLLRATRKGGHWTHDGMSTRCISERVRYLGAKIGVGGLSAHDLRHTWASLAARHGTALDRLMDAGGWASPAMPMRYIEAAAIANEGVQLG